MSEIEIRSAQLADVKFAERLISLMVMPYEVETDVPHLGRMIREVCSRGAFDKIDATRRRFTVNRGHDLEHPIGKAISFDPDHPDGLTAELRIAHTALGDETLQLASEGLLDASAGFLPKAMTWNRERTLRRLEKVWLHHVALTPDPAYPDARVLAVRQAPPPPLVAPVGATPNLDAWRARQLQERFGSLTIE